MPTYTITAPDGKEYDVTAPEGATQEQVLAYAKANYAAKEPSLASKALKVGEDIVRGVADTATFGFADELAAKVDELRGKGTYEENLAAQRQRDKEAGMGGIAGQVAGAFMSPLGGVIGAGAKAVSPVVKLAPEGINAITQGALYGAGSAEESRATGAALGAVTGGVVGAATNVLGKTAEALLRNQQAKNLPSPDQVRTAASAVYDKANSLGIYVKPQPLLDSFADLRKQLATQGITERSPIDANKNVLGLITQLEDSIGTQKLSWPQMEQLRTTAVTMARESTDPATKRLAGEVVGHLDDTVSKLTPSAFMKGGASAEEALKLTQEARTAWKQSRKADVLQDLLTKAETASDMPRRSEASEIQTKLTSLINSKKFNMFSETEKNMLKAAQKSSSTDKIAEFLSNFQAGKNVRTGLAAGALTVAAPQIGVPLQLAAYGLGAGRDVGARMGASNLVREIASGVGYTPKVNQDMLNYLAGTGGLLSAPKLQ